MLDVKGIKEKIDEILLLNENNEWVEKQSSGLYRIFEPNRVWRKMYGDVGGLDFERDLKVLCDKWASDEYYKLTEENDDADFIKVKDEYYDFDKVLEDWKKFCKNKNFSEPEEEGDELNESEENSSWEKYAPPVGSGVKFKVGLSSFEALCSRNDGFRSYYKLRIFDDDNEEDYTEITFDDWNDLVRCTKLYARYPESEPEWDGDIENLNESASDDRRTLINRIENLNMDGELRFRVGGCNFIIQKGEDYDDSNERNVTIYTLTAYDDDWDTYDYCEIFEDTEYLLDSMFDYVRSKSDETDEPESEGDELNESVEDGYERWEGADTEIIGSDETRNYIYKGYKIYASTDVADYDENDDEILVYYASVDLNNGTSSVLSDEVWVDLCDRVTKFIDIMADEEPVKLTEPETDGDELNETVNYDETNFRSFYIEPYVLCYPEEEESRGAIQVTHHGSGHIPFGRFIEPNSKIPDWVKDTFPGSSLDNLVYCLPKLNRHLENSLVQIIGLKSHDSAGMSVGIIRRDIDDVELWEEFFDETEDDEGNMVYYPKFGEWKEYSQEGAINELKELREKETIKAKRVIADMQTIEGGKIVPSSYAISDPEESGEELNETHSYETDEEPPELHDEEVYTRGKYEFSIEHTIDEDDENEYYQIFMYERNSDEEGDVDELDNVAFYTWTECLIYMDEMERFYTNKEMEIDARNSVEPETDGDELNETPHFDVPEVEPPEVYESENYYYKPYTFEITTEQDEEHGIFYRINVFFETEFSNGIEEVDSFEMSKWNDCVKYMEMLQKEYNRKQEKEKEETIEPETKGNEFNESKLDVNSIKQQINEILTANGDVSLIKKIQPFDILPVLDFTGEEWNRSNIQEHITDMFPLPSYARYAHYTVMNMVDEIQPELDENVARIICIYYSANDIYRIGLKTEDDLDVLYMYYGFENSGDGTFEYENEPYSLGEVKEIVDKKMNVYIEKATKSIRKLHEIYGGTLIENDAIEPDTEGDELNESTVYDDYKSELIGTEITRDNDRTKCVIVKLPEEDDDPAYFQVKELDTDRIFLITKDELKDYFNFDVDAYLTKFDKEPEWDGDIENLDESVQLNETSEDYYASQLFNILSQDEDIENIHIENGGQDEDFESDLIDLCLTCAGDKSFDGIDEATGSYIKAGGKKFNFTKILDAWKNYCDSKYTKEPDAEGDELNESVLMEMPAANWTTFDIEPYVLCDEIYYQDEDGNPDYDVEPEMPFKDYINRKGKLPSWIENNGYNGRNIINMSLNDNINDDLVYIIGYPGYYDGISVGIVARDVDDVVYNNFTEHSDDDGRRYLTLDSGADEYKYSPQEAYDYANKMIEDAISEARNVLIEAHSVEGGRLVPESYALKEPSQEGDEFNESKLDIKSIKKQINEIVEMANG